MNDRPNPERGSVIMMLFLAVILFGILAYAFSKGSRNSMDWLKSEKDNASATSSQDCNNDIAMATKRLTLRCGNKISLALDGSNAVPGAPKDGSCSVYHMNGGGIKNCAPVPSCDLTALAIGGTCGTTDTIVYAGIADGRRIYTTLADAGTFDFCTTDTDFGSLAHSATDGLANTNELLAQAATDGGTCAAAAACRALGPKWYLPTQHEMVLLYNNRSVGALSGTLQYGPYTNYWSSVNINGNRIWVVSFDPWDPGSSDYNDYPWGVQYVRCVRRD